ncbi:MAG: hypothetical protein K2L46_09575 [Paramuribaculum sp.]|nr:hypothetical protein [Paramuribaculum sp.]
MNLKKTLVSTLLASVLCLPASAATVGASDLIPRPTEFIRGKGSFTIPSGGFSYSIKSQAKENLSDYLSLFPELFSPADKTSKANLAIEIGKGSGETYTIDITPRRINVKAPSEAGAFYAIQSLIQLTGIKGATEIQTGKISDSPRFAHRGLMFDVSRHFR